MACPTSSGTRILKELMMTSRSTKEVHSAAASADLTVASFERRREVTVVMEIATGDCKSCYLVEHLHFDSSG